MAFKKDKTLLALLVAFLCSIAFVQAQKDRPTTYEDDLSIAWKQAGDSVLLVLTNKLLAPLEIIVKDKKTEKELRSLFIEKIDSLPLFRFKSTELDTLKTHINERYGITYYIGHPKAITINTNYHYRLPFKKNKKYEVSQGWNGKRSHNHPKSQYAIDFQLEVGEPVFAAREGVVVKAIDWFTKQGGPELRNSANRIVILHEDGTTASYVHLEYQGVFVQEGDYVERGQKIGLSGLTGYTNGPHLHFVVRKERDLAIPVYFEGYEAKELKTGRLVKIK